VNVFVPAHVGSIPAIPTDGVMVLPQLSVTVGGVGITASVIQATLEAAGAGAPRPYWLLGSLRVFCAAARLISGRLRVAPPNRRTT